MGLLRDKIIELSSQLEAAQLQALRCGDVEREKLKVLSECDALRSEAKVIIKECEPVSSVCSTRVMCTTNSPTPTTIKAIQGGEHTAKTGVGRVENREHCTEQGATQVKEHTHQCFTRHSGIHAGTSVCVCVCVLCLAVY